MVSPEVSRQVNLPIFSGLDSPALTAEMMNRILDIRNEYVHLRRPKPEEKEVQRVFQMLRLAVFAEFGLVPGEGGKVRPSEPQDKKCPLKLYIGSHVATPANSVRKTKKLSKERPNLIVPRRILKLLPVIVLVALSPGPSLTLPTRNLESAGDSMDRFSLLLRDFRAGVLTLRETATYALDSLFYPERLPVSYGDSAPAHADEVYAWLYENYDSLDADIQATLDSGSHTCTSVTFSGVTYSGLTLNVNNAKFMVHYTTSGTHATTLAYASAVASAALNAYNVMVGSLGYLRPVIDNILTCSGLTNLWHIYIFAPPGGFTGIASPGHTDGNAASTTNPNDAIGYIGIVTGLVSGSISYKLQQVVSHEFTHLIQFEYRALTSQYTGPVSRGWLLESHATYGMHVVYHTGTDVINNRFAVCLNPIGSSRLDEGLFATDPGAIEYECGGLWWEFLALHFGHQFVRGIFENLLSKPSGYYSQNPYSTSSVYSSMNTAFQNERTSLAIWWFWWIRANRAMMTCTSLVANCRYGYTWSDGFNHFAAFGSTVLETPAGKAKLETTQNFAGLGTVTWNSAVNGDGILRDFGSEYIKVTESASVASTKITITCTSNCGHFGVLAFARTGSLSSSDFVELFYSCFPTCFTFTVNISAYTDAGGEVIIVPYNFPTTYTGVTTNSQYTLTLSTP